MSIQNYTTPWSTWFLSFFSNTAYRDVRLLRVAKKHDIDTTASNYNECIEYLKETEYAILAKEHNLRIASEQFKDYFSQQIVDHNNGNFKNGIEFLELPFYKRFIINFYRYWRAFHKAPVKSGVMTTIAIAILLYLQAGILSFTPFSTIFLSTILFLSIPLFSSLWYVRFGKLIRCSAKNSPEDQPTLLSAIYSGKSSTLWTLGLSITLFSSALFFVYATVNKLLFSLFITSSATSLLPFATSLWACFAIFLISAAVLYGMHYNNIDAPTPKGNDQVAETFTLFGVTVPVFSTTQLLFNAAQDGVRVATNSVVRAAQDALPVAQRELQDQTGSNQIAGGPSRSSAQPAQLNSGTGGIEVVYEAGPDGSYDLSPPN